MSVPLITALVIGFFVAPAMARVSLAVYVLLVVMLWWLTCGEATWIWRGSGRTTLSGSARLLYAALQLNFAVVRVAVTTVAICCAVALGAVRGQVRWARIGSFYDHDLPQFVRSVADGRAGDTSGAKRLPSTLKSVRTTPTRPS